MMWNSIEEKTPEGEWLFVLTNEQGPYHRNIHKARMVEGGWQSDDYGWFKYDVVAWCLFPDKYIKEKKMIERKYKTVEELKEKYPEISEHMLYSTVAYRELGQRQGSFGESLLSNDLIGAFSNADMENTLVMAQWAKLLCNDMPCGSYGSPERYREWIDKGGLQDLPY